MLLLLALYIFLSAKMPRLAFITCPLPMALFTCYLEFDFGYLADSEVAALCIAIITVPITIAAIVVLQPKVPYETWPRTCARLILITCAWLLSLLLIVPLLLIGPLFPIGYLLLLVFLVLTAMVIQYKLDSRRSIMLYVVSTIGACIRQNLPLATALEIAARYPKNKRNRIVGGISKWLTQGCSLSEAVKRGYPKCSADIITRIAAAEKINQLPRTICSIEKDLLEKADDTKQIRPVHPMYPAIVLLITAVILLFLMTIIIPVFADVMMDMSGETLPASTIFLMNISDFILDNSLFFILFLVLFLALAAVSTYVRFRPRRPQNPYLLSRISDQVKWRLPLAGWFERNFSLLRAVNLLRVSLNAGCTVNEAIANTLGLDINIVFKKRLSQWLNKVEQGQNISSAALQTGVGKTLAWAFDQNLNRQNTPEILRMIEQSCRHSYNYRINLASSILCPCIIIGLGIVVGFVVYAMFSPMVALTTSLVNTATP